MTRLLPKPYFSDAARILDRADRVRTRLVRECEVCGSRGSELRQASTFDGFVCADAAGCGRRALCDGGAFSSTRGRR